MNEVWKSVTIPAYTELYKVSNRGRVYSVRRNKILTPKTSHGYCRVTLCNSSVVDGQKTFFIHRLVALAFVDNPDNKPTVNHINENKMDNRAENLEWATTAEQNAHGTRTARAVAHTDWAARSRKMDYHAIAQKHDYEKQAAQSRKRTEVYFNGVLIAQFKSQKDAVEYCGVSRSRVSECVKGTVQQCRGYTFADC